MPTYEYRCKDCDHEFDVVQSFSDDALTECPSCGGNLRKVFGNVGITFKGSGFYKTDSRSGNGNGSKSDKKSDGDAGAKKDSLERVVVLGQESSSSSSSKESSSSGSSATRLVLLQEPRVGLAPIPMIGVFGGSGFTEFLDDVTEQHRRHAVRPAVGPGARRPARRPRRRLPRPARPGPRHPAAPDQLPGQRLGDEGARASPASSARAPCGSLRAGHRADPLRGVRPAGRPHVTGGPTPTSTARSSTTCRSPTPTAPSCGASPWRPARPRASPSTRRHGRRHPGAPLLDPGREPLVPRRRAGT